MPPELLPSYESTEAGAVPIAALLIRPDDRAFDPSVVWTNGSRAACAFWGTSRLLRDGRPLLYGLSPVWPVLLA
jgi:hypothetical protein